MPTVSVWICQAIRHNQCYFAKENRLWNTVTQHLVGDGEVLVISDARGKMLPECHSSLSHSESELPEWRSGAFCHKNTHGHNNVK
jgi:hypothetical protein